MKVHETILNEIRGDSGKLVVDQQGNGYLCDSSKNTVTTKIKSKAFLKKIFSASKVLGMSINKLDAQNIADDLDTEAYCSEDLITPFTRVAPITNEYGVWIDIGDANQTRVKVSRKGVEVYTSGCSVPFVGNPAQLPFALPADKGNLKLLYQHLNLDEEDLLLLVGWMTYTVAHAKVDTSKYPILVLRGEQGSGKSFLCRLIRNFIDPSRAGLQAFSGKTKELAIASQNSHVLMYDNMRSLTKHMSDLLCIMSTGGESSSRLLYTDAGESIMRLHSPLVLNGIHPFIEQPDLAQRCINIELAVMPEADRKSEKVIMEELERDAPAIFKGLLDLMAGIFKQLPKVKASHPERMLDFCHWLAAMEIADNLSTGMLQKAYSDNVKGGLRDCLLNNSLADAVLGFSESLTQHWTGTPSDLLDALNAYVAMSQSRDRFWPSNPIAMSKRLTGMKTALAKQGIDLVFARGKERRIEIHCAEYFSGPQTTHPRSGADPDPVPANLEFDEYV